MPNTALHPRVRVALIGAGWVCEERHIPAFKAYPGVELTGIVDSRPERAKAIANKFRIPNISSETEAGRIPWMKEVDAVSITTPPHNHYQWISSCLSLGKDILTEKPLALTRAEGEDLISRAAQSSHTFCVVHNNLFTHATTRAREIIAAGKLGTVTGIRLRLLNSPRRHLPTWYDQLPFGLLFDELSHFLYLADNFSRNLRVSHGEAYPSRMGMTTPSLAKLTLLSDDYPVHFELDFEAPVCEWHMTILGTQGLLILDIFRDIISFIPQDGEHTALDHLRTLGHATTGYWKGFLYSGLRHATGHLKYGTDAVIKHFLNAINTGTPPPFIALSDGARVFNLLCDAVDALNHGTSSYTSRLNLERPKAVEHA